MINEYPKMLYHVNGRTETVAEPAHEDAMRRQGFGATPSDIHRQVKVDMPANADDAPPYASSPTDPLGLQAFEERLIARMRAEFFSDEPAEHRSDDKPRRGRPRKDQFISETSE